MGIRTIPCIFGEEKNQEALIFFFFFGFVFFFWGGGVFVCRNVFKGERKHVGNVQAESRTQESLLSFGLEVLGAFYSLGTDYEAMALVRPPPSNGPRWS